MVHLLDGFLNDAVDYLSELPSYGVPLDPSIVKWDAFFENVQMKSFSKIDLSGFSYDTPHHQTT